MAQKKLKRFGELTTFKNVLQYPEHVAGTWAERFANSNPVTLELACGKGEYAVGLARMHPQRNFIGIDVKGNRIWVGAKNSLKEGINNVQFLRTQIDRIDQYFAKDEVSEIWITFPDPQLRWSKMRKRLTHPKFLRLYQNFLRRDGFINLKTDSPDLYQFTKKVIELLNLHLEEDIDDVQADPDRSDELKITTHYEGLNISGSNRIFFLKFKINNAIGDIDNELKEHFKPDDETAAIN
jgi:tRNA (guanine-N7-)-methyltransferase